MSNLEQHTPVESPLTLDEARTETQERMRMRIDALVEDEELRDVIRQICMSKLEVPEDVSDEVRRNMQIAHAQTVEQVTSYTDIYGLQEATKSVFDFRGNAGHYRERWESEGAVFETGLDNSARELARKNGLMGNTLPSHEEYDVQLNLGGAANAMIYRQTYGSKIVPAIMRAQGRNYHVGMEINLGSTRPVDEKEKKRSQPFAQSARDEWELGIRSAEEVHGITFDGDIYEGTDPHIISHVRRTISKRESDEGITESEQDVRNRYLDISHKLGALVNQESDEAAALRKELEDINLPQPPNKWRVAMAKSPIDGHDILAVSAGLKAGVFDANGIRKIRPNTADTYALLKDMLRDVPVGARIVVVTSAHFTGFQAADAERLAYDLGAEVEVIGFDPTLFGEVPKPTHELLQELHSKVSSTIGVAKYMGVL